jgi:hypothetical protein
VARSAAASSRLSDFDGRPTRPLGSSHSRTTFRFVDEIQELFVFGKTGKAAGEVAEKCIKLFPALGIILVLGTQIPDKDSLPTGITRKINTRFCLSVADQVANDMILGTSAYKLGYRATVFESVTEAGWGILAGMGKLGGSPAPTLVQEVKSPNM